MNGLAGLPIRFPKKRRSNQADIELAQRGLSEGETSNAQVVDAVPPAVQEARTLKICQETVDRTYGQSGTPGNLLRREALRGFAEQLQKTQPALQGRYVVLSL